MNSIYNKGFTLVELMVVVTIIGILAGMSLLGMQNFQAASALDQSANELKFEITQASLQALRNNRSYNVIFARPDNYGYQVWTTIGGVSTKVDSFRLRSGTSFNIALADTVVVFSRSGAVLSTPAALRIKKGNRTKTLTILSSTGEVIIQ
jgi:prepilin-type N-terminal cleavage/methylation domain-containing protein